MAGSTVVTALCFQVLPIYECDNTVNVRGSPVLHNICRRYAALVRKRWARPVWVMLWHTEGKVSSSCNVVLFLAHNKQGVCYLYGTALRGKQGCCWRPAEA